MIHNGVDLDRFRPGPVSIPQSGYRVALDQDGQVSDRTPLAHLLTDGAGVPLWSPHPDRLLRLVWVGKITPMKGWDRLEALARRLRRLASITVLLGHSPAYSPVTLTGRGDVTVIQDLDEADLPGFYRAADWLLCTSRWEGFGLAIAEALACGTPVLLPERLGTAPELLAEGGGITYCDGDHLASILTDGSRPVGRLPATFNWDTNTDATLALYRQLTAARTG